MTAASKNINDSIAEQCRDMVTSKFAMTPFIVVCDIKFKDVVSIQTLKTYGIDAFFVDGFGDDAYVQTYYPGLEDSIQKISISSLRFPFRCSLPATPPDRNSESSGIHVP